MAKLNVGQQFSMDPAGRFYSDGTNASGEQFREEQLWPALQALEDGDVLTVILDDGPEAYGSSFLTEGFAGIVKYGYMSADKLLAKLKFQYQDPDYKFFETRIIAYISEAHFNSRQYTSTKPRQS